MQTVIHTEYESSIAEVSGDADLFSTPSQFIEMVVSLSYEHDVSKFIVFRSNIPADFFDLKTQVAGEILQKVTNYRLQLAIVGDFNDIKSDSFQAFVAEIHRGHQLVFTDSVESAKSILSRRKP